MYINTFHTYGYTCFFIVKQDNEAPEWNETFTLYVQSPDHANLHVNVSDKDVFSADDELGQGLFSIQDLLRESDVQEDNRMEVPIPLYMEMGKDGWFSRKRNVRSGTVFMDVQYIPWEQPSPGITGNKGMQTRLPKGASPGVADWERLLEDGLQKTNNKKKELESKSKSESESESEPEQAQKTRGNSLMESMNHKLHHALSIENESTDTQGALWADFESKVLLLSFRGTEQIKVRDIMTDINLFQSHYFPNTIKRKGKNTNDNGSNSSGASLNKADILCHTGFLSAFRSISPAILQVLYAIFSKDEDNRPWRIHITGHSLGK